MDFNKIKRFYSLTLLILIIPIIFLSCKKPSNNFANTFTLNDGWYIRSSADCKDGGEKLSTSQFDPIGWYPASIPSTVLAALIKNNVYKDPFFGKNLETIPKDQFKQSWWYCKEFSLKDKKTIENVQLVFEGINSQADIWLNGKKIASSTSIFGAFRIFEIDISKFVNKDKNFLAVEVFPPEPGVFTIGFVDWNPRPPDENMGIWREVKLRLYGPVSINNTFVQSQVNLETLDRASLTVTANIINHTNRKVSGTVKGEIENLTFSQPYSLKPFDQKEIRFSPDQYPVLNLKNPRLWWPNNLGEPNLYEIKISATVADTFSDGQKITFGIREVSDYINKNGHRGYKINGKKVLIRGGGWVDDLFLADTDKKIEAQIKYTKHMNLNTIRLEGFWGSSQKLYDLADQNGILLMPGWSCHWEWENYLGKPVDEFGGVTTVEEMDLVARSLRDQVVWLRNHPSIYVWVLGSDLLPRPALEKRYYAYLEKVDPTRPTLGACKYMVSEISGPSAVKMLGPYDYVTPNYWYIDTKRGGAFGFNTETGPGPQPPPMESIKRMIPEDHLWPINDFWDYHCARNEFNTLDRYVNVLNHRYGKSESLEEFVKKAQVANYEAIRPMFEAFGVNKHNSTGVIQWMLNSAWPAMFWQLYDHYLLPSGAFYGTRKGSQPINIVYNYGNKSIYIVNDTLSPLNSIRAEIRIFNCNSKEVFRKDLLVSIKKNTSIKIMDWPDIKKLNSVYFLDLKLKTDGGTVASENFYWLSSKEDILDEAGSKWHYTPNKKYADFTGLNGLPAASIDVRHRFEKSDKNQKIHVTLTNSSDKIAFFIELKVMGNQSSRTILPVFWDDNYVSLLPGEVKTISAYFAINDLKGEKPVFKYSGWNVKGN